MVVLVLKKPSLNFQRILLHIATTMNMKMVNVVEENRIIVVKTKRESHVVNQIKNAVQIIKKNRAVNLTKSVVQIKNQSHVVNQTKNVAINATLLSILR